MAAVFLAVLMAFTSVSLAADGDEIKLSPDLEAQAKSLEGQIVAYCCWRAPVADHYSGVADEVRRNVRLMLKEGKSENEILDSYVKQYGTRILSAPPAEGFNLMSWILPFAALALGGLGVTIYLRRNQAPAAATAKAAKSGQASGKTSSDRYEKMLAAELREE